MAALTLVNGATTITIEINGGVAKINRAFKRYAIATGLATDMDSTEQVNEAVLRSFIRDLREVSRERHRKELVAQRVDDIDATVNSENDFAAVVVIPPPPTGGA